MLLILFLPTLTIGLLAQWHVKRTYLHHSRTPTAGVYTGAEAAQGILLQAGITKDVATFICSLMYFLWQLLPPLIGRQRG